VIDYQAERETLKMRQQKYSRWVNWLLAALVLAAWGCSGPAAAPEAVASRPPSTSGAYQDDLMPAATPDPVPDPEAGSAAAPGSHLDAIGTITELDAASIAVDGLVYGLTSATEIKGSLAVGGRVKLEYLVNADGSRTVIEAKSSEFFDD
jgi:hypothetical protein